MRKWQIKQVPNKKQKPTFQIEDRLFCVPLNLMIRIKSIVAVIIFLSYTFNGSAQNIVWEAEITVASATIYGNVRPRLALTEDNQPMVIMTRSQNGQIYFTKGNNGVFSSPIALLPATMQSYIATWTGPDFDAKGDTIVAVFKAKPYDNGHVYTVRSTDGGLTFSDTIRADNHDLGLAWMPSMTMDGSGNPIITYMAHDANYTNPRYVYVRSNDAGITYSAEQIITSSITGEACDCCPAEMVADGNNQVLLFRNNELNTRDIYGVYSNDNGANFISADDVDGSNWVINSCPASGPHGSIQGSNLFSTFMSGGTGNEQVFVSRSTLGGSILYQEKQALTVSPSGNQNFPRIATENNLVVVAWAEYVSNNLEIFTAFATSNNLIDLTTSHQQANVLTNGIQTNPDIRIKDGIIHLIYQDATNGKVIYRKGQIGFANLSENDENKVLLYPNPISAGEEINLPESWIGQKIIWRNMMGKTVHITSEIESAQLNTPYLSKGIYFLQLENSSIIHKINLH